MVARLRQLGGLIPVSPGVLLGVVSPGNDLIEQLTSRNLLEDLQTRIANRIGQLSAVHGLGDQGEVWEVWKRQRGGWARMKRGWKSQPKPTDQHSLLGTNEHVVKADDVGVAQ